MYIGFSKHSIIKTFHLIYTFSALFILCFHCSGCTGKSIVGRAVILPVRLSKHFTMQEGYRNKARFFMKSISLLKQSHISEQSSCALPTALMVASTPYVTMDLVPVRGREDWYKETGEGATRRIGIDWTRDWRKVRGNLCQTPSDVSEKLSKVT